MRSTLWSELNDARLGYEYLGLLIDRQRGRKRLYNASTILLSTSGIFGWKIWQGYASVACIVISVIQAIQLVENYIITPNETFEKLSELRIKYLDYSTKLEQLWHENEAGIDQKAISKIFYQYRSSEFSEIQKIINQIKIPEIPRLIKMAEKMTDNYFHKRLNY